MTFEKSRLRDAFPASPGHLLVVPRRHVATWFDASEEERTAILKAFVRGCRFRLLTGDYLGVTEPDAIVRLLDLAGER